MVHWSDPCLHTIKQIVISNKERNLYRHAGLSLGKDFSSLRSLEMTQLFIWVFMIYEPYASLILQRHGRFLLAGAHDHHGLEGFNYGDLADLIHNQLLVSFNISYIYFQ